LQEFKALLVEEREGGSFCGSVVQRNVVDLPEGDVLIRVRYSSLNYKDALSASGNKGVTRNYPHTPGIDAAGEVLQSDCPNFQSGDEVIVIGYDLGMNTSGGFGQLIRVPHQWVVKRPDKLGLKESMILGTAGFTAALCVEKLLLNGTNPENGDVLVTGATGGVGAVAVAILGKLGYTVVGSTGKSDQEEFLTGLGAARVIDRCALSEENPRPLLREEWAAAVDVVGGNTLVNILKTLKYGSSVACCGLVESPSLPATVLPFILRGVNLLGIDSVNLPLETKNRVWNLLASDWKLDCLDALCQEIGFNELAASLSSVLEGKAVGRLVLNLDR